MNTLQTAIEDFLLHCRFEKSLSEKTLKAYRTDLLQLKTFLSGFSQPLDITVTKHHLREFLVSMASLKPKSIKRKIATIKSLFNYLEFEDKIPISPFRKMRIRIKEDRKLPVVMNVREISRILKKAYDQIGIRKTGYADFETLRNIIVIELLFSTGARVSEIANLKITDINLEAGVILIKGKGNKERLIHICNQEPVSLLKKYYKLYSCKMVEAGGYVLVNRFNSKLTDQSIRGIVKKYVTIAGINRKVTPHTFRHSFATLLLEKDVDIRYIQQLLGHSSIATTQLYTHVNRIKQRQILQTKHPRREFSFLLSTNE